MKKKDNLYFKDFIVMAEFSCQASELLLASLANFDSKTLYKNLDDMHKIENNADIVKHVLMERLVKEFVPPIDCEDIIHLANELDSLTDIIEDILIRIDMYNVKEIRPTALEFVDVIFRCCKALHSAMVEFPNFKKSTHIKQAIIDVNSMEEEGDMIYISSMRELYRTCSDPVEILVWSNLYDKLEECCDVCEHVANAIEIIIMKNS